MRAVLVDIYAHIHFLPGIPWKTANQKIFVSHPTQRQGPKNKFFYVILVLFVVKYFSSKGSNRIFALFCSSVASSLKTS
jgi:hypothetical protein